MEEKVCKGGCKRLLSSEHFGINEKTRIDYKQCIECREKKSKKTTSQSLSG